MIDRPVDRAVSLHAEDQPGVPRGTFEDRSSVDDQRFVIFLHDGLVGDFHGQGYRAADYGVAICPSPENRWDRRCATLKKSSTNFAIIMIN